MTEHVALMESTEDFNKNLIGYLPVGAAFFLVSTGNYRFFRKQERGYILKKVCCEEVEWRHLEQAVPSATALTTDAAVSRQLFALDPDVGEAD